MTFPLPRRAAAFAGALALDALLGDPPTALHPVGWLGRAVRLAERAAPRAPGARRAYGVACATAFPLLTAGLAHLATRRGGVGALAAEAVLLDSVFALRTLLARADEVRCALERGDLETARALLARHLVSRDTGDLAASEVAGAAVESVAENLGDGVLGPWFAYAVLGLPGAAAYRAVNTLDSMWGYRAEPYGDLGWAGARIDDLVNLAPARLAALAIAGAACALDEDAHGALETWRRDAGETDSPNAGHPMAAMAGALGVRLTKRGAYALGSGREPRAEDIGRAVRLARGAALGAAAALVLVLVAEEVAR
ncbi:MAG: adenosylcobinamide-phosphate synthase CbiB [Dehalococcoidia bacterium]